MRLKPLPLWLQEQVQGKNPSTTSRMNDNLISCSNDIISRLSGECSLRYNNIDISPIQIPLPSRSHTPTSSQSLTPTPSKVRGSMTIHLAIPDMRELFGYGELPMPTTPGKRASNGVVDKYVSYIQVYIKVEMVSFRRHWQAPIFYSSSQDTTLYLELYPTPNRHTPSTLLTHSSHPPYSPKVCNPLQGPVCRAGQMWMLLQAHSLACLLHTFHAPPNKRLAKELDFCPGS